MGARSGFLFRAHPPRLTPALLLLGFLCSTLDLPTLGQSTIGQSALGQSTLGQSALETEPPRKKMVRLEFADTPQKNTEPEAPNNSSPSSIPESRTLEGELITENATYGTLILTADGELVAISPKVEIESVVELDQPLIPTPADELGNKALQRMPASAKVLKTDHFVVCYDTSETYARWNANLYERMFKGMMRFWKEKGFELEEPRFPLVALIFRNRDDYIAYSKRDFRGGENTFGYYTQTTNRLATFDLTGIEGVLPAGAKVSREELLAEIFSRPEAERQIATILHEACHQIAFNTGLQTRLGDYPLWVSEGIATFFESPDLRSAAGWAGAGKVNPYNLLQLRQYARLRPTDSLRSLLTKDDRFRQTDSSTAAYAEGWGLTFYLLKRKPKEYVAYLRKLGARLPGDPSDPQRRLDDFQDAFGDDLEKLDKDFSRFIGGLR
jgi:hypothetical protein